MFVGALKKQPGDSPKAELNGPCSVCRCPLGNNNESPMTVLQYTVLGNHNGIVLKQTVLEEQPRGENTETLGYHWLAATDT